MESQQSSPPIVFLYLFLVATGVYSIVVSLIDLGKDSKESDKHSTLETKIFKYKGPAGFVYGLVSILAVIGLVKYASLDKYEIEIKSLNDNLSNTKKELEYYKYKIIGNDNSQSIFKIKIPYSEPMTIFGGKVIVSLVHKAFSDSYIEFKGIYGVANNINGPFNSKMAKLDSGLKYFVKLENGDIWGLNILNHRGDADVELYKP
jgi:hypothetical protein